MEKNQVNKMLLLKSGFWYTVSNYLTRAMVFITMPLFTRLMTKEQYGDFSVFANLQAILLVICGLESYSTINRARFDFESKSEFDEYITSSLLLSSLFTMSLFMLYLLFPNFFFKLFLLDSKYIYIMFSYLLFCPAFIMFQAKQRIEYKYFLNSGISFFASLFAAISSVVLVMCMPDDRLMGRILGQYVPYAILGFFFYLYFLYSSHSVSLKAFKYSLRMGLPMVFSFLGSQVLLCSDSLIVKHMSSAEAVSYLSVVHTCSHIVLLLIQTINGAWAPWFYDMLKANSMKIIRETYMFLLWFAVFCTLIAIIIGPEIVLALGGQEYMESLDILPAYVLCGVFTLLTAQFSNLESYHKKPEYAAILTMIGAVINIILNVLGIQFIGYKAVCYATVLSHLMLIILHYCLTLKMDIQELLPIKNLMMVIITSLLFIPYSIVIYKFSYIRYIFLILIIIFSVGFLIIKRNDLYKILKKINCK